MHESTIYKGRPEKGSRLPAEERSYDLLDALGIPFTRVDHDRAVSMDDLEAVGGLLGCTVAKNLFLTNRQQTQFYLLVMPGNKPFKTKYLSAQLGCSRLSFAGGEQLEEYLGVKSGSAGLPALMNDPDVRVRLVLDRELLSMPLFACHPCINTTTVAFSTEDMLQKLLPALRADYAVVDLPNETE